MNMSRSAALAVTSVLFFVSLSAKADLIVRLGGQAVYDTDRDITWIANANLGVTQPFGVIGVSGGGNMDWATANDWIAAMNAAGYLGFSDWRLPTTQVPDDSCTVGFDDDTPREDSRGYNCTGSELGHLFYNALGAKAGDSVLTGDPDELAKFSNVGMGTYWSGTEIELAPDFFHVFVVAYSIGFQNSDNKTNPYFGWAVRDGDVVAGPPPVGDVTGVSDVSSDAVQDVAHLTSKSGSQPKVRYYSGANRQKIRGVSYLGTAWMGVAAATVIDSDADGVADDPAVAVLGHKSSVGKHTVEVRRAANGELINKIDFLGPSWEVLDVAVIDDKNGDGVTGDTLIAVLGYDPNKAFDQQIKVQVRRLSDGSLVANWFFLNGNWMPVALEGVNRMGQTPLLAVLANKPATGANVVQARKLSNGSKQRDTSFFNASWVARDVSIVTDSDGDGTATDPAYLVLANHTETGRNKVQSRRVNDGMRLQNITMLGTNWDGKRVTGTGDISGNLREEVGVLAEKKTDGTVAIQLKDYQDRTTTATIFP